MIVIMPLFLKSYLMYIDMLATKDNDEKYQIVYEIYIKLSVFIIHDNLFKKNTNI
jgi:hypothetical protein